MTVLQLEGVSFSFGGRQVFSDVDLAVNEGERIALVGPNGVGKTTLLRVAAGEIEPEQGRVSRSRGMQLAFLRQSQLAGTEGIVLDALLHPFQDLLSLRTELRRLEHAMSTQELGSERYGELLVEYEAQGGHEVERNVEKLAADLELGSHDLQRPVKTLSGGERRRLALAQVLASEPDILLLDEPTNHLDLETLERLETLVRSFSGSVLIVSHDRAFLNATCPTTVELAPFGATRYTGNYGSYVEQRRQRLETALKSYERERTERERQEELIRRTMASGGFYSRQAKARQRRLNRLDPLEAPKDVWSTMGTTTVHAPPAPRSSKVVLNAKDIGAFRGGRQLFSRLDLEVLRGERIGIVGPNGAGKSTLLTALMGAPDQGEVTFGHGVIRGLCGQELEELHPSSTPIDEIRALRPDLSTEQIRSHLGLLRIRGEDQERKNETFSGGERARVALAKLLAVPRNLLALDEPTNNLDIPAREVLEEGLQKFEGAVIVVSHDRYFLDRVATRLIHIENGEVEFFWGSYEELRRHRREKKALHNDVAAPVDSKKENRKALHQARKEWLRRCERLRRTVAKQEEQILKAEVSIEELEKELVAKSGHWQELERIQKELEVVRGHLDELMKSWSTNSEELEQAEGEYGDEENS